MSGFTTFPIPNINIPALPDVSPVTDASLFIMERAGTGRVPATALRDYMTAAVASQVAPALNDIGRNVLINPAYHVQQRGPGPWTTNGSYTADRWIIGMATDAASATIQPLVITHAIADERATYYLQNVFTGTAGGACNVAQRVENVRRLSGKALTLSFWAWASSGAPKLAVSYDQFFGTGGSPSADVVANIGVTPALTPTPTRYSFTFTMPSVSGKTLGTVGGTDYTHIYFWYSAGGASYAGPAGGIGQQSGTVQLFGAQLEVSSVASPLDYGGTPQQQWANCQRFYQRNVVANLAGVSTAAGQAFGLAINLPVVMRATPTLSLINNNNSALGAPSLFARTPQVIAVTANSVGSGAWLLDINIDAVADL